MRRHRGAPDLNAKHDSYRWGLLTFASSLLLGEIGFQRTIDDLSELADADEVYRELKVNSASRSTTCSAGASPSSI